MLRSKEFRHRGAKDELFPGARNPRLHQQTRDGPLAQISLLCHEPGRPTSRRVFQARSTEPSNWDNVWNFEIATDADLTQVFTCLLILRNYGCRLSKLLALNFYRVKFDFTLEALRYSCDLQNKSVGLYSSERFYGSGHRLTLR